MPEPLPRKLVSVPQACRLVGVSRRTLYNWMDAGKVEYIRTAGGPRRIYEDTLWRTSAGSRLNESKE